MNRVLAFDKEAAQITVNGGVAPSIDCSCVQGWTGSLGGAGNFDQEPAFCDPVAGDFRLPAEHPALKLDCYPRSDVPGIRLGVIR